MLKEQGILLGFFGVFFFVSTALGQPQSDPNSSNTPLSQSESVTIIQAIHAAELRTRNHIDKKSAELSDEISELKTKEIPELKTALAVLNNEVNMLKWWLIIFITLILIPLVFPGLKTAWRRWVKGDRIDSRHSSSFRQIRDFASSGRFSGTPHSENRDSAEGS